MTFNDYQNKTLITAEYPLIGNNIIYPAIGIAGEAGELLDKIKKHWRNKNKESGNPFSSLSPLSLTAKEEEEIIKEMGDVLWYLAALSNELRITLEEVANKNIEKLISRKERGVVCSEGDNR